MSKKYTPDEECFNAANAASGQKLNREEIHDAFQRVSDYKQLLQTTGNLDNMTDKLRTFAEREGERTKIAAAMQKRHAAMNILVRDRLDQAVDGYMKAGLSPRKAILAIMEGTQRGVEGGRNSVAALTMAYEKRFIGGMMGELQANRPHLIDALRDPRMDADVTREMAELKEGGKPGVTGNKDAEYVAKVFASYAELSRTDLNRRGASIGKLEGWTGSQIHDDIKMIGAGKDAWISSVLPKLDIERTFPDLVNEKELTEALSGIYDTIITGMPNKATPREMGQRVNPANLAKSLGKSRVLHFKDADAAMAYREQFGYGNTVSGMVSHLRNAAKMAANMDALGPNPEIMFGSLVDGLKRKIKEDASLSPADKAKNLKGLDVDANALRQAFDVASGLVSRPVNATAAKIGSDIRAVSSMAKLGGALFSSVSDVVTPAIASMFRGSGFFKGLTTQLEGLTHGRPKGEAAEISYLLGQGYEGIIGQIVHPAAAVDGPVGYLSKMQETFFKWNGLSWWTDIQRATAGRMISAEMGMRAKTAFNDLPANYKHVLGLHSIDETKWEAIRKAGTREADGNSFITPDLIRQLDDADIEPLVAARIEAARKTSKLDDAKSDGTRDKRQADFDKRKAAIIDDGKIDLELSLLRFFADETSYGVVEPDAASRRLMTQGTRPGTFAGEGMRFIGQFKGFPIAFTQRVGGRALYGHSKDASILEKSAHIGTLLAGMSMAGYMAMTMKDLAKGYWPPRDPSDPKVWLAALQQGGALGIYGDYLFSQKSRFGSDALTTAIGPTIGTGSDIVNLILKTRDTIANNAMGGDDDLPKADAINLMLQNTPFINLFYTRPVMDYLFLNSMREAASPGYLRRTDKARKTTYGQQRFDIDKIVSSLGR